MQVLTESKLVDFDAFTGNVKEDGGGAPVAAGLSTLGSVGTGMGAPVAPTRTSTGSGDVFSGDAKPQTQEDKPKKKKKKGRVFSYNEYLKQL
jgi:hypothetical protein